MAESYCQSYVIKDASNERVKIIPMTLNKVTLYKKGIISYHDNPKNVQNAKNDTPATEILALNTSLLRDLKLIREKAIINPIPIIITEMKTYAGLLRINIVWGLF